jgi:hypothetical protein
MFEQILSVYWMLVPQTERTQLAKDFKMIASGHTEIRDSELITDGFTNEDLKAFTLEAMCEYIGSKETYMRAWELTVAKAHSIVNPPIGVIKGADDETAKTIKNVNKK